MAPSIQSVSEWHLFLSHYHWDHIQGLPFFAPAYNPNTIIHIYGPQADLHNILSGQMSSPYFPVTFDGSFTKNITFHPLNDGDTFELRNVIVSCRKMFTASTSAAVFLNSMPRSSPQTVRCWIRSGILPRTENGFTANAAGFSIFWMP